MTLDPSQLSLAALRRRLLERGEPITGQLLHRLQRDPRQGARHLYQQLRKRRDHEKDRGVRLARMLHFERLLWNAGLERLAGVDEAGVGPMAGPVVAAAVVFPQGVDLDGVDDSKRLLREQREELEPRIREAAAGLGIGVAEVAEIDRLNVYHAALLAMRRAVEALPEPPQHLLVDARQVPGLEVPQTAFDKGDGINFSIAAASIVAKVHRDRLMEELDRLHPEYGFARHKGYCTPEHQAAVRAHGPSPVHRRSFTFVDELCGEYSPLFYELQGRLAAIGSRGELAGFEEELALVREELAEREQRKLRLTLARRWKALRRLVGQRTR